MVNKETMEGLKRDKMTNLTEEERKKRNEYANQYYHKKVKERIPIQESLEQKRKKAYEELTNHYNKRMTIKIGHKTKRLEFIKKMIDLIYDYQDVNEALETALFMTYSEEERFIVEEIYISPKGVTL